MSRPPAKDLTTNTKLNTFNQFVSGIWMTIQYSWVSIFIIVLMLALVSLGQGQTIFISLLDHSPVNLLLFFILSYGLAKVLSHYPEYIDTWSTSKSRPDRYEWDINYEGFPSWIKGPLNWIKTHLGLGIITFSIPNNIPDEEWEYRFVVNNYLRKSLGLVLFFVIIFLLFNTLRVNYIIPQRWHRVLPWIIVLFFIGVHVYIHKRSKQWTLHHGRILYYSSIVLVLLSITVSSALGWSRETILVFSLAWIVLMLRFILFRAIPHDQMRTSSWIDKFYAWNGFTSYVLKFTFYGLVSILVVIYAHINPSVVNPLLIVLAYLNIIYGLVILPIKGYLYHKYLYRTLQKHCSIYLYTIPLIPIFLIAINILAARIDNDLHLLPRAETSTSQAIPLQDFLIDATEQFSDSLPIYYIASYGGGLKANAWNLLVLSELNKRSIIDRSILMSGVSGGSLGQHLFTGMVKNHTVNSDQISKISTANYLSVDLAHLLGIDYIREFLPDGFWTHYPDRALRSMDTYASNLGDPEATSKAYPEYWSELYAAKRQGGSFYPLLISNSTGTHDERGVVSSIDFSQSFDSVFSASTDILYTPDQGSSSGALTYLYAASCTNRFPVFSPAAKVENKGHFLDGGYFENSGLVSLLNVYDYLDNRIPELNKNRAHIIQIVNDKNSYIRYKVDGWIKSSASTRGRMVKPETELSAVLTTVSSINHMPRYVNEMARLKLDNRLTEIHLPYRFTIKDVEDIYAGQVDSDLIKAFIVEHNAHLSAQLLKNHSPFQIAEPPLARLLGDQAYKYMEILAPLVVGNEL